MTISAPSNAPYQSIRAMWEPKATALPEQKAQRLTGSLVTLRSSPKELSVPEKTISEQLKDTLSATKKTSKPPVGENIQRLMDNKAFKDALENTAGKKTPKKMPVTVHALQKVPSATAETTQATTTLAASNSINQSAPFLQAPPPPPPMPPVTKPVAGETRQWATIIPAGKDQIQTLLDVNKSTRKNIVKRDDKEVSMMSELQEILSKRQRSSTLSD
ncbi:hypothetical protein [Iodobacter fluviatilis]|uniref:Uncharacterized protein n=1 Tax=Iodobacter fluviatilis TaxID=537 RepID=A0A377Q668_9NEIS|nr:hypothetical protein [Iodobacter fluviatilis]TCU86879.1 hypothetical protein EV682_1054 [Iodobacter fluviatilis]STQ90210.1 Uncharacterised protein [Iodobacter fluviatilis]